MLSEKIFAIAKYADQNVLIILLLMSVFSIGMIFERYLTLTKIGQHSADIQRKIKLFLLQNNTKGFKEIATQTESVEGRAASFALKHIEQHGEKGFEELFNSFVIVERSGLEKYLVALATIASNAPFIGLLGTVLGIMKAFNDLSVATEGGQQTVMAGISVALIATAAGLFVAIPAGIFYNYYSRKVKSVLASLESVKELGLAYAKTKGS